MKLISPVDRADSSTHPCSANLIPFTMRLARTRLSAAGCPSTPSAHRMERRTSSPFESAMGRTRSQTSSNTPLMEKVSGPESRGLPPEWARSTTSETMEVRLVAAL